MKNILYPVLISVSTIVWSSVEWFSNIIIDQHRSKIKDILCQDWPNDKIETNKNSWLNDIWFFLWYTDEFYKDEKQNLDTIKINVETIDWKEIYTTAEEILQSIYMLIWSIWMEKKTHNNEDVFTIPLSDWHKFVLCNIMQWSETILRVKAFIKSKWIDVDMIPYLFEKDFESLKKMKEFILYHNGDINRSTLYITKDWSMRYFRNPHWDMNNIHYSTWATQSPYKNIEIMKKETKIPQSLWETDFFTNYINAKNQTEKIFTDPTTGYRYYDPNDYSYKEPITEVVISWENHRNIQRFLLQPHFTSDYRKISKDKWRLNAFYDIYKYFLFIESKNQSNESMIRDIAFNKAKSIIEEYIDPIINSRFEKWMHENYYTIINAVYESNRLEKIDSKYFVSPYNLYDKENRTFLVDYILQYNSKIFLWEKQWIPFWKKEIEEILIDYNIYFRKKNIKDAKDIAERSIDLTVKSYNNELEKIKWQPITEYKIIQEWDYPESFESWDYLLQEERIEKNPDKVRKVQEEFTEENKQTQIMYWSSFKFLEE